MGLLDWLFADTDKKNEDKKLDNLGLEKWEKKEVKKGDYKPWNFEEEELEDDDYYFEDD